MISLATWAFMFGVPAPVLAQRPSDVVLLFGEMALAVSTHVLLGARLRLYELSFRHLRGPPPRANGRRRPSLRAFVAEDGAGFSGLCRAFRPVKWS